MNTQFLKSKGQGNISRVLGICRQTVANYIKGNGCITVDQAIKLSEHYGVPLTTIIDPGYEDRNAALTAENSQLRAKLATIQSKLQSTCQDIESIIQEDKL